MSFDYDQTRLLEGLKAYNVYPNSCILPDGAKLNNNRVQPKHGHHYNIYYLHGHWNWETKHYNWIDSRIPEFTTCINNPFCYIMDNVLNPYRLEQERNKNCLRMLKSIRRHNYRHRES